MYNNKFLEFLLNIGRRAIPRPIFKFCAPYYHWLMAYAAAFYYRFPSRKLIVIGITGTKGKSTTVNFVWSGLTSAGLKSGLFSTANIRIGNRESPNIYHMTMPSPFIIQKFLSHAILEKCTAAIIETTSEGILQFRHKGINYDFLIFTNLTPEHIRSHGSFENYRAAKQLIFENLSKTSRKFLNGSKIPKVIIANADSDEALNFLKFAADKKVTYGTKNNSSDIKANNVKETKSGVAFEVNGKKISLKLLGAFNVLNALPAIALGEVLKLNEKDIIKGLEDLSAIPGRMEVMQQEPFTVIVDYAHEKESLNALLNSADALKKSGKIILLIGAEGGGRDKTKRPIMGEVGARRADYLVVSNVDPYEERPTAIIKDIADGATSCGMKVDKNLFLIEDREEGIRKAIFLAHPGDLVLITGKGSEQSMIIGKRRIPWDDRAVLRKILYDKNSK